MEARTAELARSVGELEALGELSKAVNSTLDLDTVLQTFVAKAVQLSDTDAGTIYVFSGTSQQLRLRATFGMSDELIAAISDQAIGLNDLGIGDAAWRRAPVQVPHLSEGTPSAVQKIVLGAGYRGVWYLLGLNVDGLVRPRGKLEVAFATALTVSWRRGGGRTFGRASFALATNANWAYHGISSIANR